MPGLVELTGPHWGRRFSHSKSLNRAGIASAALRKSGIDLPQPRSIEPNLEDVFLSLLAPEKPAGEGRIEVQ